MSHNKVLVGFVVPAILLTALFHPLYGQMISRFSKKAIWPLLQQKITPQNINLLPPGTIQVFVRCTDSNNHGALCRIKGPTNATLWESDEGRRQGYQFAMYPANPDDRDFDDDPTAILDTRHRKIHVLAGKNTGDLGGAVGLKHITCDADSISCTIVPGLFLESQLHYKPGLAFIAGNTPENDKVIGFQHGGYGGQLRFFTINTNDSSMRDHGWVGDHMDSASQSACGRYANIDGTPSVVINDRTDGGRELHLFARAGHGNPLHLYLIPTEFQKLASGDDSFSFRCEKFEREGRARFRVSPKAIMRNGNHVQIFGVNEQDPAFETADPYLWPGTLDPDTSRFDFQEAGVTNLTLPSVPSGDLASLHFVADLNVGDGVPVTADATDPHASDVDVFINNGGGNNHIRVDSSGRFTLPADFSSFDGRSVVVPVAAVKVSGVMHLFEFNYSAGRIQHVIFPRDFHYGSPWPTAEIIWPPTATETAELSVIYVP